MKFDMEHSFRQSTPYVVSSKEDLLKAFHWKDQNVVTIPKDLTFPLKIDYFFSWIEPSGTYTFLLFKRPNWDSAKGLVFRRIPTPHPGTTNICDWCHSYGSSDEISMLNVKLSSKQSIGQYLCSDLSCLDKLETQMGLSGKSYETLAAALCDKVNRFYERTMIAPKEDKE